jgi:hypothetical protein
MEETESKFCKTTKHLFSDPIVQPWIRAKSLNSSELKVFETLTSWSASIEKCFVLDHVHMKSNVSTARGENTGYVKQDILKVESLLSQHCIIWGRFLYLSDLGNIPGHTDSDI